MSQFKVVAAIPCYNTEKYIKEVVTKTKKHVDQVIVIDDGSTDNTAKAARSAGAKVISHKYNLGKGTSMITVLKNTYADIIVFLDGDGQHNPEEIPLLLVPILEDKADLVIGSRHLRASKVSSPSFIRRLTNIIASLTISIVTTIFLPLALSINRLKGKKKTPLVSNSISTSDSQKKSKKWITDCTSGFRAIKREMWEKLNLTSAGFEIETEIIYEAVKNNLVIAEVPISCHWDSGRSKLSIFRDGLKTIWLLINKLIYDIRN